MGRMWSMHTELMGRSGRALRVVALGLALAFGSLPVSAMEELTVDGSGEAAHHSAQRARFESQMNAYGRAVGEEFRRLLEDELVERVCGQRRLAALGTRSRG